MNVNNKNYKTIWTNKNNEIFIIDQTLLPFTFKIIQLKKLKDDVKSLGFEFKKRHWAHALHSPYWWMQCLFWRTKEKSFLIKSYHSFLVWDMTKNPLITKILEYLLQPFIGKSVVMYFENKEN